MVLEAALEGVRRAKELGTEQAVRLNDAIFNLADDVHVSSTVADRVFSAARRFRDAYVGGRLVPEARPEYIALLGTLQNQYFFSTRQGDQLITWLSEALSRNPAVEENEAKLRRLQQANEALRAERDKYLALQEAVRTLQTFVGPAQAERQAKEKAAAKAEAKAEAKAAAAEPSAKAAAKGSAKAKGSSKGAEKVQKVEWQVETDFGFQGYDRAAQEAIKAAAASGSMSYELFTNGQYYRLDFARMLQINPVTHKERKIRLLGAEPPSLPMPKLNFRRLMAEFRQVEKAIGAGEGHGLRCCEPIEDSLLEWSVDMTFDEGSKLQESLENLAATMFDPDLSRVQLRVRFPVEYPMSPPEVWLRRPRMKHQSGPVSFGGRICTLLLTSAGWQPGTSMIGVLEEVRKALVEADLEAETAVSVRRDYPKTPMQLQRLKTELYPTANGFKKDGVTVLSPAEAAPFLGDVSRMEATDKIGLPFCYANEIYSRAQQGGDLELPLIFEVKTLFGRKTHCAIYEFIEGLPAMHALLPKWVMEDLDVEERELVTVRGVGLDLITYVKVQPHSVDFYEAVRDSGVEVQRLLTESLSRFSALTEDTAVPIEISGKTYSVQIVELRPRGSVRIIDMDVQHHFEFQVDFEPAPDLEDEVATKAVQDRFIQAFKLKREHSEVARQELRERRGDARKKRLESERMRLRALAGADDGKEGSVDVVLRLPNGSKLQGKFREGAPVAALAALALGTEWAENNVPWGVHLRVFPNKALHASDSITKELHRAAVSVQEEQAPEKDEELFAVLGEGSPSSRNRASTAASADDSDAEPLEEPPLPERDEQTLEARTQRAFEVQRFIRAGYDPEEAVRRFDAGEILPPTAPATRAPPRPPLASLFPPSPKAAPAPQQLERTLSEDEECQKRIQEVMNFTGVDHDAAEEALKKNDFITESAVNCILDSLVG